MSLIRVFSSQIGDIWIYYHVNISTIIVTNNFDTDQNQQNVSPDLDPNCFTLWWHYLKDFFKKREFFGGKSADRKKIKNYPAKSLCS